MKGVVRYRDSARDEWDRRTEALQALVVEDVLFGDIFDLFLPRCPGLRCLEVGAVPGNFLAFLHRRFGYRVTGLDFASNADVFHETMRLNGVTNYDFLNVDFTEFATDSLFDIVASFGFIEHFDDVTEIVDRHCALVSPGGYLVLTVPNFRRLQLLYHWAFDRSNLAIHNRDAMRPRLVAGAAERAGLRPMYVGYEGGFELWREGSDLGRLGRRAERVTRTAAGRLNTLFGDSVWTSAYLVMIFRRSSRQ